MAGASAPNSYHSFRSTGSLLVFRFCLVKEPAVDMNSLIVELRRRRVFRVGMAYVVFRWLVIQRLMVSRCPHVRRHSFSKVLGRMRNSDLTLEQVRAEYLASDAGQ